VITSSCFHRLPIAVIALALVTAACGDDDAGPPVTADTYEAFRAQPAACGAETPPPATEMTFDAPGDAGVTGPVRVVITTSCGDITIELDPGLAPQAVNSFVFLAEEGYFDGQASHRVVPGNFVQAGDPTASGLGSPGYRLPDELPPAGTVYTRGTIAMANAGPNTAGSQFFIMLADLPLPPSYSIFGRVVGGFETLDLIESIPLGQSPTEAAASRPMESLYLERVTVAGS
jgi:cyclophilin family peptidyl-prolyl cis-trans isomerase